LYKQHSKVTIAKITNQKTDYQTNFIIKKEATKQLMST